SRISSSGLRETPRSVVRVEDAVEPQPGAAQFHGHADDGADRGQVEVEAEELEQAGRAHEAGGLAPLPEVEVTQPGHDRQGGGRPPPAQKSAKVRTMDLSFTPEEEAFRDEVRTWLDANLPAEWRHRGSGGYREEEDEGIQREWQRRLYEGGWLTLAWPRERGGRGATPVLQSIYAEEMARAGGPPIISRPGVSLLSPVLSVYGSGRTTDQHL